MSWIQELYVTYEKCQGNENIEDSDELCPVGYSIQNAHIEITIDGKGNFINARLVQKADKPKTLIPITESSSGRTSGEDPHPLCDSLQYCAKDYPEYGGKRPSYFNSYIELLRKWAESEYSHPKVKAVYQYVKKGTVIKDLAGIKLLIVENDKLVIARKEDNTVTESPIMKLLTYDDKGQKDQGKVFIRWVVKSPGNNPGGETWTDPSLFEAWQKYLDSLDSKQGFCYASGTITTVAKNHPKKLRSGKDGAKIISSNDTNGYTYLGRFTTADQAIGLSSEITQKAHSALRWLIGRKQAYRNGEQVFIAWDTSGNDIPSLCADSREIVGDEDIKEYSGDVGQAFAIRLKNKMQGYQGNIKQANKIVVMGLDSAVPGRMAITFYRELRGSEFLARIEKWHARFSWPQYYGKDPEDPKKNIQFIGAPAPRDIAWAAFGKHVEGKNGRKFMNATVERILPCIVDETIIPMDIVRAATNKSCNRIGHKFWEWEKCLGIACALYKGTHIEEGYSMSLDEERITREYLYGRLLAIADVIESTALAIAKENRDTNAARLMQRFSMRPYSTWQIIEESLDPYMKRIKATYPGLWEGYKELLDIVEGEKFKPNDYTCNESLTGEYLLGYHSQRRWLKTHKRKDGQWVEKSFDKSNGDNSPVVEN